MHLALILLLDVLLVANRGGSTITFIDPVTMQSLGTATAGFDPHEIAVSPDGTRAYVSNYGAQSGTTLSVIDVAARAKIGDVSIAPLAGPHGIVFSNGKVWFTADGSNQVGRYDPATGLIDWIASTTQAGGHMLAVRADGTAVYTANIGSGTASIIDAGGGSTATARKIVPAVPGAEGIALSPDGRELWIGSRNAGGGAAVIDLATETRVATLGQGRPMYRLLFTRDGRFVLAPRSNPAEISVFDAATRTQVRAIPIQGAPLSMFIAPDNHTLYVATTAPNRVYKVDFLSGQTLAAVDVLPVPDGLAYAATPQPQRPKRRSVAHR
ncbi:MAG TPA: cytochrome D1 domain-containing protein [Thermoanaerobaculia bacterium]|jgi:DNA-binding beta-propeller fold protein YncE